MEHRGGESSAWQRSSTCALWSPGAINAPLLPGKHTRFDLDSQNNLLLMLNYIPDGPIGARPARVNEEQYQISNISALQAHA